MHAHLSASVLENCLPITWVEGHHESSVEQSKGCLSVQQSTGCLVQTVIACSNKVSLAIVSNGWYKACSYIQPLLQIIGVNAF